MDKDPIVSLELLFMFQWRRWTKLLLSCLTLLRVNPRGTIWRVPSRWLRGVRDLNCSCIRTPMMKRDQSRLRCQYLVLSQGPRIQDSCLVEISVQPSLRHGRILQPTQRCPGTIPQLFSTIGRRRSAVQPIMKLPFSTIGRTGFMVLPNQKKLKSSASRGTMQT